THPGGVGKQVRERRYWVTARRGHGNSRVQRGEGHRGIRWMIGKTKVATHDAAVIAAIAARQGTKLPTGFPTGKSVLQIPTPNILADVSSQSSHIANLGRRDDACRLGQDSVALLQRGRVSGRR